MSIKLRNRLAARRFRIPDAAAVPAVPGHLEADPPPAPAALARLRGAGGRERAPRLAGAGRAREPALGRLSRADPPRQPAPRQARRRALLRVAGGPAGAGGPRGRGGPGPRGRRDHRAGRACRRAGGHRAVRRIQRDGRRGQGAGGATWSRAAREADVRILGPELHRHAAPVRGPQRILLPHGLRRRAASPSCRSRARSARRWSTGRPAPRWGSRASSRSAARPTSTSATCWTTCSSTPRRRACCSTWRASTTAGPSSAACAPSRGRSP